MKSNLNEGSCSFRRVSWAQNCTGSEFGRKFNGLFQFPSKFKPRKDYFKLKGVLRTGVGREDIILR